MVRERERDEAREKQRRNEETQAVPMKVMHDTSSWKHQFSCRILQAHDQARNSFLADLVLTRALPCNSPCSWQDDSFLPQSALRNSPAILVRGPLTGLTRSMRAGTILCTRSSRLQAILLACSTQSPTPTGHTILYLAVQ